MLTNEEAMYLIGLPKLLKDSDLVIDLGHKKNRIELISPDDPEQEFFIELTSNSKILLKTSIHHQETLYNVGLLRIDFKGTHFNPDEIIPSLPDFLKKYRNKHFTPEESHIHIYVEGYKPLAWAVPLSDYDFAVKSIDHNEDIIELLYKFGEKINLQATINIKPTLF